jgi:hypothetical protein
VSMKQPSDEGDETTPNGWSDLSEQERGEIREAFARAEEEYRRGECIPADEVIPRRLRRAG